MPLHNIIAIMYLRQIFLFKDYSKENHIGILQVYKFIEIIILTNDNDDPSKCANTKRID